MFAWFIEHSNDTVKLTALGEFMQFTYQGRAGGMTSALLEHLFQ
jgi:hypothetical protein